MPNTGIIDINSPIIQVPMHRKSARLRFRGLNLNVNTMRMSLSAVSIVNVITDTSLESMERTPAVLQVALDLQVLSCWKYSPCHFTSTIPIISKYNPIRKSAPARLTINKDCTGFSSLSLILQIITNTLPIIAKTARIHTETCRLLFFIRSAQLENSSPGESHSTSGMDFVAKQQNMKLSTVLKRARKIELVSYVMFCGFSKLILITYGWIPWSGCCFLCSNLGECSNYLNLLM